MRVEISKRNDGYLILEHNPEHGGRILILKDSEFTGKHHEGVWNSRVLAFVPQPIIVMETIPQGHSWMKDIFMSEPDTHFSDGTPVASYEQFN